MVHVFTINDYKIAIDGNSGSIHVLDDIGYHVLKDMKEFTPLDEVLGRLKAHHSAADVIEVYDEIRTLKEQGLLFAPELIIDEVISADRRVDGIKALCLNIAHNCNLSCEYCFASKGDYNSGRTMMPKKIALRAVDFLLDNSGKRQNIEIDFFGGEPLMNFGIVEEVVAYGKEIERKAEKKFYFTITTNGTLLDQHRIDFINQHIDNVVISLDGRKEVHDSIRYDRAG